MQNLEEKIASRLGTDNEVANGLACSDCRHILNEDHNLENCYGLDFDGSSWISCKCKRFKSGFDIKVDIYEDSSKKTKPESNSSKVSNGNLQKTFIPTFKKIS
jgi:hypothetical protein